jgi:hypothetical protein
VEGGSAKVNNARRLAKEKRETEKSVDIVAKPGKRARHRRPETPEEEEVVVKKRNNGSYFAFEDYSA